MNYAGTTDFNIVIDGVKRASKTFSATGHYIEIPAILNEDGSVNETATEKNLDGEYFKHYATDLEKQTLVEIYLENIEVGEI